MKFRVKYLSIVPLFVWIFFCFQLADAQDPGLENIGSFGTIDWVGQKVVATGIGAPPTKYLGKPKARPMAQRAAVTVARRNLLEVIKGVHIDSTTRVENSLVQDDTIVARVKGLLNASTVEGYRYLDDGTVEATVSIPLTGQLGQVLVRMASQTQGTFASDLPTPDLEGRIRQLEERVRTLEETLSGMKKITLQQEEMISVFKQFVAAWADYAVSKPLLVQTGYETDNQIATLNERLKAQESRLENIAAKLDDMTGRLDSLEKISAKPGMAAETEKPKKTVPYTGLVIDARDTGFRPCLKPEVYGLSKLIYPGNYVDLAKAIQTGYVRYYRQIGRAQQSARAGSLPYTIKAKGTFKGKRSLEIDAEVYNSLKAYVDESAKFLVNCNVVIVF
jgi:uncharacterized coiled-coil protein SlyX